MSSGDYLTGCLFCLAFVGLGVAAALVVADRRLRWMEPWARGVAIGLLTAAAIATAQLIPLLLGVLTRGTALVAAAVLLALASRLPRSERAAGDGATEPSWRPATIVAVLALAVAGVYVVAFLIHNRAVAIGDYDSTSFILPVPARWIQTGSMWRFDDLVPGWGYGAYPQTGSLMQLVALLPWHNDFALRLVNLPFMALAALAATEIAAELGASRAVAATFAIAAVMLPAGAAHALDHAQPDMIMAAGFTSAALFLLRYVRTRARTELVLAGVGLGIALGTKGYGGPELAALLIVWLAARLLTRERFALVVREVVVVGLVALLVGGCWMLRNLVVGGDPLYPGKIAIFGLTIFDGPALTSGSPVDFSLAHYFTHPSILRHYAWPAFRTSFGWAGLLIAVCALVAAIRSPRGDRRVLAVAVTAVAVFGVYTLMPYSALGTANAPRFITAGTRYATTAFLLAGACAAALLARADRRLVLGLQGVAVLTLFDSFRRYDTQVGSATFHVRTRDVVVAAVIVAAVVLAWLAFVRVGVERRRVVIALAVLAGVLVLGVAGRKVEQDFNGARYRGVSPAFDALASGGRRVALSGEPDRDYDGAPYLAFGRRLSNRVTFVGHRDKHLLLRSRTAAPFKAALAAGRYQLLLLGWDLQGPPPELQWARSAGWRQVATGNTFTLLEPPATARSVDVQG